MYIAYFDETGDDGYPKRETDLFVLTSGYLHHANWQSTHKKTFDFRHHLHQTYKVPIKLEMHTKYFLLNKNPYREFGWEEKTRLKILQEYADFLATLDLEFINVVINKQKITPANETMYMPILDAALKFNVQRIENTIKASQPGTKFMIISDEGRIGVMRKTTRRIQKINFIPSKISGRSYRREIELLLEDPLPKDSKQSFFIQHCDYVSLFVYLRLINTLKVGKWHNRLSWLKEGDVEDILNRLTPVINLKANSGASEYGFVVYPR